MIARVLHHLAHTSLPLFELLRYELGKSRIVDLWVCEGIRYEPQVAADPEKYSAHVRSQGLGKVAPVGVDYGLPKGDQVHTLKV